MSAHEAHEADGPVPSPGDENQRDEGNEGEDRAAAGAARLLRRHGRTLIVVLVVVIAAYAAFAGPGNGGGGGGDGDRDRGDRDAAGSGAVTTADPGAATTAPATTAPGATEVTDPAPTSTEVPPDVEEDRPAVDLATPPPATDPVEVARWWAATYTAYVGAGPPADLVERLADWTTPALLDELRALPPAASYDAPLAIDGVSEVDLPASAAGGAPAGSRQLRVSVQTPVALVIYDMTLVQGSGGARWLVSEAARM
jgi:hypothetical protein